MLLSVFLAFCLSGFAASSQINEIQTAVSLEPGLAGNNLCGCSKEPVPQCGCCDEFEFDGKDHKVCMNMTYVKEEKGLRFTVVFDGKVVFNQTLSAKHPPPFCQGTCPLACICENYYNLSYGDDNKWGGCLEIYGDLVIRVLDIKFGCFYLPVPHTEQETIVKPIEDKLNQSVLFNDMQQWLRNTLAKKMRDRRLKKKNPLNFLYKNRVEEDNEK
ncbi:uncharacterized protein LOC110060818 isoform X2 [Orbicella faveolata]|uniref:uncharacterized protein LOC110060818 isoform X2 n=1 Tax=Orbicella faveolata TaxID=48498 RepID=UPI0009E44EA8|nr:uncharacterized protein LOC110060818 isoform X2 [Orbicella faveolata]